MKRLSDEELDAWQRDSCACHPCGETRSMAHELKERRAADLTLDEVDDLRTIRDFVNAHGGAKICNRLTVLVRLIAGCAR